MVSLTGLATSALVVALQKGSVLAVPSPQTVGSDLAILTHNDLYGSASTRQAAVIVLSARQTREKAQLSCSAIGENLWVPGSVGNSSGPAGNGTSNLQFLRYLDYGKITDDVGQYWVSSGSNGCRAITTEGEVQTVACDTHLPALCSQSAPWSSQSSSDTASKWQTSVTTDNATVVGYRDRLSFRFLGLRYAARPARFGYSKYERPAVTNISVLSYGPQCIQLGCTSSTCSEDCLFLNIWTPYLPSSRNPSSTKKKAVMLWIHGGGFTTGTGSDPTFDGGNMASRGDVVVVTINYRLSTLGFLALDNSTIKGNYGLADQITALDWLRAHIEDFGGDKDRITIFGQSAGAASVRALLASPQAKAKFSGAIMMSNPGGAQYASTFSQYLTIAEATQQTKAILNETGCTQSDKAVQLACLRAQDPFKLTASSTIARYPVVDGTYLTSNGLPLDESASRIEVPVMMGVMRDDGGPFSRFSTSLDPAKALQEQGFNSTTILGSNKFPVSQSGNTTIDIFNLTSRVMTDSEFRCLGQSTAVVVAENRVFPAVWSYEFHRAYQIIEWNPNPPTCTAPITSTHPYGDTSQEYFKCHSGELYYVFGTLIRQARPPRDDLDIPFSQYIVDTWTAFGRDHNPNPNLDFLAARGYSHTSAIVSETEIWKPVRAEIPSLRILDTNVKNIGFSEVDQCNVLGFPLDYYSR
ncbi:alpha/beta-hydrolase [Zopfia rhizophila CBS 207.26]|uniref:Carboxylic ester hydrolase n=1 Tax=Zopfia rhizophila CBS 207.26 TaxID=1314779 RepID=A0A6A6DSC5_9PEZI|nr:alpha/beta-hydrolase [Zopfia rhizophila CBS 207.26]